MCRRTAAPAGIGKVHRGKWRRHSIRTYAQLEAIVIHGIVGGCCRWACARRDCASATGAISSSSVGATCGACYGNGAATAAGAAAVCREGRQVWELIVALRCRRCRCSRLQRLLLLLLLLFRGSDNHLCLILSQTNRPAVIGRLVARLQISITVNQLIEHYNLRIIVNCYR